MAAVVFWSVRSRGENPDVPGEEKPAPAPVSEVATVDEDTALAKMRRIGYFVDDESDAPVETPTTDPGHDRISARGLQNLAVSLAGSGDLVAAEEAFREAIAADPTYRPPHYALAELLRRTGRFDEADHQFWTSVDIGLGEPEAAIVKVATQYRNRDEYGRAGRILDEGRRRYPDSAEIWLHLGALLGEVGDFENAVRCLRRAITLNPDDPLGYRNLAAAQRALGNHDGARRSLTEGLQRDPGNKEIQKMLKQM